MSRRSILLLFLCSSVIALVTLAQAPPHPQPSESAVPITLGQSVIALTGPWKFHVGDDPQWSDPTFDDSTWETIDLTPTPQTTVHGVPIPGFVSGWTSRGHAGYSGFAWYRIKVRITQTAAPLTLLGPEWFDDGYQVFINGRLIGSLGSFDHALPKLYSANPEAFALVASDYAPRPDGTTLLAFRFYMAPDSLSHKGTGGMHAPPIIGLPASATAVLHLEWERKYRRSTSVLAAAVLYFFLALLIAMIFAFTRTEKILLWPLAVCVLYLVYTLALVATNAQWLSEVDLSTIISLTLTAGWYGWLLTFWAYFGLQNRRWLLHIIVAIGVVDLIESEFFVLTLRAKNSSAHLMSLRAIGDLSISACSLLIMLAIARFGWKNHKHGQWPLFLALLFSAIQDLEPLLGILQVRTSWQPFGVLVPFTFLCTGAKLFFFSIVLFRQFRSSLQRQQSIAEDLKQAQEVQHLLIPDRLPHVRGWAIESEYRPAREVGGDFFQILPHPSDGSTLIIAGDVAGKGLQAGMMVALLLGAIRTESEHSFDPIRILTKLNQRLLDQEHAQATCLALLVKEDGSATLANAGHLPPYCNGVEIDIEGSLPLGMVAHPEFPTLNFHLQPSDRLILISDGIVEAENPNGDLFGFDRIRTLLSGEVSAADIADTAQAFGQQDDISVLSIVRAPALIDAGMHTR